jgi:Phage integrase, N-terminal SAM-like domain
MALFERKAEAERHDVSMQADISRGQYIDPRSGKITIAEYAAQWRAHQLHRDSTADMVERAFRLHILPVFGHVPMADARASHIRAWVKTTAENLSASTVHLVYSYVKSMFAAAAIDKIILRRRVSAFAFRIFGISSSLSRSQSRSTASPTRFRADTHLSPILRQDVACVAVRFSVSNSAKLTS